MKAKSVRGEVWGAVLLIKKYVLGSWGQLKFQGNVVINWLSLALKRFGLLNNSLFIVVE